jgi:hypothetical protein
MVRAVEPKTSALHRISLESPIQLAEMIKRLYRDVTFVGELVFIGLLAGRVREDSAQEQ